MKILRLIIFRDDVDELLRDLILLGCVDVAEPGDFPGDANLSDAAAIESIDMEQYNTNCGGISLFGTERTLLLTGWVPASSGPGVLSMLSKYECAWDLRDPAPEEKQAVPVNPVLPGFLKKLYKGTGRRFTPLVPDPDKNV